MDLYELKYFDYNGRGAAIRLMLAHLRIPFTNTIVPWQRWEQHRKSMPFHKLPVLVVNGGELVLSQSVAILRYLAAKHGLLPLEAEQRALADAFADQLQDFILTVRPFTWAVTQFVPSTDAEIDEKYLNLFLPAFRQMFAPVFEKQLTNNGTGFIVGESLSWVDFFVADFVERMAGVLLRPTDNGLLGKAVSNHRDRIFALPHLANAIEERKLYVF